MHSLRHRPGPRRDARPSARRALAGMSLIEIMVVMVIIAVAAGGLSIGFGALTRANLRSAATRLAAASKYAYHRAIANGSTVRVVLDTKENTISIEEAAGTVTLARADEDGDVAEADSAGVDPWAAARAKLEQPLKPSYGASPFSAITDDEGNTIPKYAPRPVGDGIRIGKMFLPHEVEPRTEGKGAIYFFPGGRTEHAVIQFVDRADRIFSVELHPLTGRAEVHTEAYEPRTLRDEDDSSEARDPG